MVLKKIVTILACSATTLAFAGPGHSESSASEEKPNFAAGQPGENHSVDRTIQVEASDRMRFSSEEWSVKPDETIRFVVSNTGQIPHEFVIDTIQGNAIHREGMMEAMAEDGMMQHDDPNSVSVAPGESGELIWTFSKSGNFEAACNIPGHYQAGMHARIGVSDDILAANP